VRIEPEGFTKKHLSGFRELVQIVTGIKQDMKVCSSKVDIRLPEKGNSNSHGAMPVY
jgi:hypothetical protein